jgi:hypothetical protein
VFIGEPYERAMAYYYRGLLYWRDGEIDNARADVGARFVKRRGKAQAGDGLIVMTPSMFLSLLKAGGWG